MARMMRRAIAILLTDSAAAARSRCALLVERQASQPLRAARCALRYRRYASRCGRISAWNQSTNALKRRER